MPATLTPHRIAILAHPSIAFFELGCAIELFALDRPEFGDWYQTEVVTLEEGPIAATGGVSLNLKQVRSLKQYDTLVIPSWSVNSRDIPPRLARQVKTHYSDKKRILTFCSGAFLLAELGLMKNHRAVTHWKYIERFRQQYPEIELVENVLYTFDGQIGCSAGSSAAIDLGIEVIRHDFGYAKANAVARRMVMSPHRVGDQAQFVETPVIKVSNHFQSALDWAIENLNAAINVDDLALRANMSRRTFDRKFKAAYGTSAKQWLIQQRLALSKRLLESEHINIQQVAVASGFESDLSFRHQFKQKLGITPKQYRACFAYK